MKNSTSYDQNQARGEYLEAEITKLAAHIHAATWQLLELIREYDETMAWSGPGLNSVAHWLNWKCGMNLGAARERVRVAHALPELPKISEKLRLGEISYSKVRAMTRVATAENEDFLLMVARHGTASHVERVVRQYRKVKRIEALEMDNERHYQRKMDWFYDDDGYLVLKGRLTPEAGAVVIKALQLAKDHLYEESKNVSAETPKTHLSLNAIPFESVTADAMLRVAEGFLAGAGHDVSNEDTDADRDEEAVHLDNEADAEVICCERHNLEWSLSERERERENAELIERAGRTEKVVCSEHAEIVDDTELAECVPNGEATPNNEVVTDIDNEAEAEGSKPSASANTNASANVSANVNVSADANANNNTNVNSSTNANVNDSANVNSSTNTNANTIANANTNANTGTNISPRKSTGGDRYLVHIHTDMNTLKADGDGAQSGIDDKANVSAETSRRLSCDAAVVHWLENHKGEPLSIGRKSRTIPPSIRRALQRRDQGCRFPGCTCKHYVDAHHIKHWADGGETSMDNLVLLCRKHHRFVHEEGFGVHSKGNGRIDFTHPDGTLIPVTADGRFIP